MSHQPNESWWIDRRETGFSNLFPFSSYPPRITTRGSWIWSILAATFGHLLPRTPARIREMKRGVEGSQWKGDEGARWKGEKGKIRLGEKGGWRKKIRRISRTGVDRFVWSLIWSQECILLRFFFIFTLPLRLDPHPARRGVLFHSERTSLAAPSPSFSLRF